MRKGGQRPIIGWIVVGFAGWTLGAEKGAAQAQNGPETILYSQSPGGSDRLSNPGVGPIPKDSRIGRFAPGEGAQVLTPGFIAAALPRLSFDASSILFVGRKDGTAHLGVWEMTPDGKNLHEVAHCDGDCLQAEYLSTLYSLDDAEPSRRIVFTCQPGDGRPPQLFTCRLDGSDMRQVTFLPTGARDPFALPDGRLLFRTAGQSTLLIVHTDGTDLTAYGTEEQKRFGVDGPRRQARLRDGRSVESRWIEESRSWGVVAVDGTSGKIEVLYDTDGDERDPVVVAPSRQPPGHSSVVRDTLNAELFCLDAALTGEKRREGPFPTRVRLWGATLGQNKEVAEDVLGEFLVEEDGSFFIEVPARHSIRLDLLGQSGELVASMKNWTWVMPGERRGCIGCHENPLLTPPNRHVLALRKPAQKLQVPGGVNAMQRPIVRGGTDTQP